LASCLHRRIRTEIGNPSLGIRELEDGRVLLRCHAYQCAVEDIVGAVGLDLADLFPAAPIEHGRRERRPFPAADVLACLSAGAMILVICSLGPPFKGGGSDVDHERLSRRPSESKPEGGLALWRTLIKARYSRPGAHWAALRLRMYSRDHGLQRVTMERE